MDENLSSVIILKSGHTTIGFFMFNLELSQFEYELILGIDLDYIYVNKKNRNNLNWLYLSTGLAKFINLLLASLIEVLNNNQELDIVLRATFASRAGAKIGTAMSWEINKIWESLALNHPQKETCFGDFSSEMD